MAWRLHRLRLAVGIGAVWMLAGCSPQSDDASSDDASSDDASSASTNESASDPPPPVLAVGEMFPDLDPVPVEADMEPFTFGAWMGVALVPQGCAECEAEYYGWGLETRAWWPLEFVTISRRPIERLASIRDLDDIPYRMFSTETPLYPLVGAFDEPEYVLVDPSGVVRFQARKTGTDLEKRESVRRAHKYLRLSIPDRCERLADAFPRAAAIELVETSASAVLDGAATHGLASWYGIARDDEGSELGFVFPVERDTNCDVCDALFLAIGVSERGIEGVVTLEPVISDGLPVDMSPLFQAVRGVRTDKRLSALEPRLSSKQAETVARKMLALALVFHKRLVREAGD